MSFPHDEVIRRFKAQEKPSCKGSRMFYEGTKLYSFGHHFLLAEKREWGAGVQFLINGDKYSSTTSKHQNEAIRSLKPNIQVPFSALRGAGLLKLDHFTRFWGGTPPIPTLSVVHYESDSSGNNCRFCGEPVHNIYSVSNEELKAQFEQHKSHLPANASPHSGWIRYWHKLGTVVLRNGDDYYLSDWDTQERNLYFLCKLPRPVTTVAEALESLKPQKVIDAEGLGIPVKRQGDVFFIKSDWDTRELGRQFGRETVKNATVIPDSDGTGRHYASERRGDRVRGIIRHSGRDHKNLKLGYESWWIPVKNTATGSWSAVGNVD